MRDVVQKIFDPKYGDTIFQCGIQRKFGTELGNGWVCVGNEKTDDGIWCCKLKYCRKSYENCCCYMISEAGCSMCSCKNDCGEYQAFLEDSLEMLTKIDKGEDLTQTNFDWLITFNGITTITGYSQKKRRIYITIVKVVNRYFAISWSKRVTKNVYHSQPEEVFPCVNKHFTDTIDWLSIANSH